MTLKTPRTNEIVRELKMQAQPEEGDWELLNGLRLKSTLCTVSAAMVSVA